jgi:hypothetical protein
MQVGPGLHFELAESLKVLRELKNQGMAGMCLEGYSEEQVVYEHFGKHSESAKGKDEEDSAMQWEIQVLADSEPELMWLLNMNNW